jgi:hypothetical protein
VDAGGGLGIIGVDDRDPVGAARHRLRQAEFRGDVLLARAVEVEVLGGDSRVHRSAVLDLLDAPQGERVARGLEGDVAGAGVGDLAQPLLEVGRRRRRQSTGIGDDAIADAQVDGGQARRQQPRALPGRLEHGRGRRLAVGAGHPGDEEPARRVTVERRRQARQRSDGILDDEHRGVVGKPLGATADDGGDRSPGEGVGGEVGSVPALPRDADEEGTGAGLAGIVDDAADLAAGDVDEGRQASGGEEVAEGHAARVAALSCRCPAAREPGVGAGTRAGCRTGRSRRDARRLANRAWALAGGSMGWLALVPVSWQGSAAAGRGQGPESCRRERRRRRGGRGGVTCGPSKHGGATLPEPRR